MTLDGKSAQVKGYEIHVGRTDVNETALPVQLESGSLDGAVNQDNSILVLTYMAYSITVMRYRLFANGQEPMM